MPLEMKYFVLNPKAKSGKDPWAIASHSAMFAYADAIEEEDRELSEELRSWARNEIARMGAIERGTIVE